MAHDSAHRAYEAAPEAQYGRKRQLIPAAAPDAQSLGSRRRFRRTTYVVIILATSAGWFFAGREMAAGLLVGGVLSLLNEHLLWSSVGAIFRLAQTNEHERVRRRASAGFLLRYFLIALMASAASLSGWVDLTGLGIGLASFVAAVMMEALWQLLTSASDEPDNPDKASSRINKF
jgi:hypothetical protein